MKTSQPTPGEQKPENNIPNKKNNKFGAILKKVGLNVWLAVMVIGGALAFITALFLL